MAYYVYILASKKHGTLYTGVTNNLSRRVWEHKQGIGSDFTKKYSVHRLVHIEAIDDVKLAIQREKTLKEWKRDWKIALIEKDNPDWNDLYSRLNA
ncbi:GIY-YIG nuclease family protein [Kordiimonas sp. SCSIO 12610]|nr:GIY-YIG nuclease family protein [Kordiimonas sp. SCSIO 12610]